MGLESASSRNMPSTLAYVSRGTKSDLQDRTAHPLSTLRVRELVSHPSDHPYHLHVKINSRPLLQVR